MKTGRVVKGEITVTLDFEEAEFIAMELPPGDGFTREWWRTVMEPLHAELQAERERMESE